MEERPDADEISRALSEFLSEASPASDWWLNFAYHYTDVRNAVKILESGCILSRERVEQEGRMRTDNANPSVIDQSEHSHDWARLYFRPKTPTQYRNEGIKPRSEAEKGHCPVPVFFLFDLECVLRMEGVKFSNSGLNKVHATETYSRPEDLVSDRMPAKEIYSYGYYNTSKRPYIKDRRHAEIVIKEKLPLEPCLRGLMCRSVAEKETINYLIKKSEISKEGARKYKPLIKSASQGDLFYKDWTFVENVGVELKDSGRGRKGTLVEFSFWPSSRNAAEYDYEVVLQSIDTKNAYRAKGVYEHWRSNKIRIEVDEVIRNIRINLMLDGELAYAADRSVKRVYN